MRRWPILLFGLCTLGAFGFIPLVWWFGRRDRGAVEGPLIVLGARVFPDGRPSMVLRQRVARAAERYRERPCLLLLSGGAPDGRPTEAAVMAALLVAEGVPPAALELEPDSHTTDENAQHCSARLLARGITLATVVTDRFHLLRARQLFRRHGLEVATLGSKHRAPRRTDRLYWLCREGLVLLTRPALWFPRRLTHRAR